MFICGIDPGMSGAIVIISQIMQTIEIECLPITKLAKGEIDILAATQFLQKNKPDLAIIERVHGIPKWGCVQNFNLGKTLGQMIGACSALNIPYQMVRPHEWKQRILVGMDWKGNKLASVVYIKGKYPDVSLHRTERSRIDDHNIADALCMAEYGRMLRQ